MALTGSTPMGPVSTLRCFCARVMPNAIITPLTVLQKLFKVTLVVAYTVKAVMSRKWCMMVTLLQKTISRKYRYSLSNRAGFYPGINMRGV